MGVASEIYLNKKWVSSEEWDNFIKVVANYNGILKKGKIIVNVDKSQIRYYIITNCSLPATINKMDAFMMKDTSLFKLPKYQKKRWFISKFENNLVDIINTFEVKNKGEFLTLELTFWKLSDEKIITKANFYVKRSNTIIKYRIILYNASNLLSVNFESNKRYLYKSSPKYLDINKIMHLLSSDNASSILGIETFPYLQGNFYLDQNSIDFFKHSIVLGSSGCGKSKFLSLFIHNIYKREKEKYKIVMIDPHASMLNDIGGMGKVIDFSGIDDSINLFMNNKDDIIASTELLMSLFKGLIGSNYNSKLERVLRHSIHILLEDNNFNFKSLRKLLLDIEYRNELVNKLKTLVPVSVIDFFLMDFNDLKTKSYGEAISPIISFIDEMEMIPVFNEENVPSNLSDTINDNFLTLFSLDRTRLGDKVTKTISGLLMQQLLTLIQSRKKDERIIFIVDEVSVVENPILSRFLSEARKYNLSLILAGQYFNQISDELKNAIFANVINYYIFRVSKLDATSLVDNFNMKVPLDDSKEQKIKILSELNNRECVVRISANDLLLPAFKARTLDYKSIPYVKCEKKNSLDNDTHREKRKLNTFKIGNNISLKDILISNSSSRKEIKK